MRKEVISIKNYSETPSHFSTGTLVHELTPLKRMEQV